MILILFAQFGEAASTIEHLRARPIGEEQKEIWSEDKQPSRYAFEQGEIHLTDIGIPSAIMTVAQYGPQFKEVWNFGLAGALRPEGTIGELTPITQVGKYVPIEQTQLDPLSFNCLEHISPTLPLSATGLKLITSDFPIHSASHKQRLSPDWDLVDMEGYGIAYACKQLKIPCKMWKIVSDFSSEGGRALIRQHKSTLSKKISLQISSLIHKN